MNIKHKEWISSVLRERNTYETRYGSLRLEKNERVTPFPENFWRKIRKKIIQERVTAYPEVEQFYAKLGAFHHLPKDYFIVTAGSDAAIRNAFDICVKPLDGVVSISPTYAMVDVYCDLYKAKKRFIPFDQSLSLDIKELLRAIDRKVSLVILANPNSPTGTFIDTKKMEMIVRRAKRYNTLVLIDEAYHGFCPGTCVSFVKRFNNVAITRTFSKACGLAGLRIGYIVVNPKVASLFYKFRPLYEVNSMALLFAEEMLDNWSEVESYIDGTRKGKAYLINELEHLGFSYVDTHTNFIHVDFKKKKKLAEKLFEKKRIKVRRGLPLPGFENFLRITLAPKPAMMRLVKTLEAL